MPSLQPISSAAMSALIQELDPNAAALFGDPFAPPAPVPGLPAIGKLARVLNRMRRRIVPLVLQSLNTSKITVVRRTRAGSVDDPLASHTVTVSSDVYAAVSGPTAETLARAWQVVPNYEVLIAATALGASLTEQDAIKLDNVSYDVVGIQALPNTPPAVAYRYVLARAA